MALDITAHSDWRVRACKQRAAYHSSFEYSSSFTTHTSHTPSSLYSTPIRYGWLAPAALSVIAFLFFTVEQMAIEIEQPFGDDANDLPLEDYIVNLEKTLLEMLPGHSPHASAQASFRRAGKQTPPPENTMDHSLIKTGIVPPPAKPIAQPSLKSMTTCTSTTTHYAYDNESSALKLNSAPLHTIPGPPPVVPSAQPPQEKFLGREASYLSRVGDEASPVKRMSSSGALGASKDYKA